MPKGNHGPRLPPHLPRDPVVAALVEARVAHGLTRAALAARMGYHAALLAKWERELCQPRLASLRDWADALGFRFELQTKSAE
jgi:transcriptional regulator with XRE-family HTH domain